MGKFRKKMLVQLYTYLESQALKCTEEIAIYHLQSYTESDIDMSIGVLLDSSVPLEFAPEAPMTLLSLPPTPQAASIVHCGNLYDIRDVVIVLYRWLGTNDYTSIGQYREIHLAWRELDVCSKEQFIG
jgi:hypothetical protein